MGLGTSIFLIAVGAILDFAVSVDTQGFNLHTIGVILMVVGAIGVVLSLIFWSSWGGFHSRSDTVVVDDGVRSRY
jgi:sulfite exporter TauE/SafE